MSKNVQSGERWVIQEQFVQYLDVSGFKRKYPKIERRKLEGDEIKYLYELKESFFRIYIGLIYRRIFLI